MHAWRLLQQPPAYLIAAGPRGNMQDGAVLGTVDVLAAEHGIDLALQVRCLSQVGQELRKCPK